MFDEKGKLAERSSVDLNSFEAIVDCYQTRILRYIQKMVGDRELSADLLQDTFLAAYVSLMSQGRLEEYVGSAGLVASVQPLLYTIARNKAITELRRRKCVQFVPFTYTRPSATSLIAGPSELDAALEYQLVNARGFNLEAQVVSNDELKRAFERVGRRNLRPLLLHVNGFSYREIEQITGETMSCIRSKIFRSKKSLRQTLLDRP